MLIFLTFVLIFAQNSNCLHLYAGAQQTYLISQSTSLKNIYACRDKCFKLNETFNYPMKYTRIVWAKPGTNHMYLEGHCYVSPSLLSSSPNWLEWNSMPSANLTQTPQKYSKWQKFANECESKFGQIAQQMRNLLQLTKIHSSYIFYSDGKFQNTRDGQQGDINSIFNSMLKNI